MRKMTRLSPQQISAIARALDIAQSEYTKHALAVENVQGHGRIAQDFRKQAEDARTLAVLFEQCDVCTLSNED